jgi:hypothetical protein
MRTTNWWNLCASVGGRIVVSSHRCYSRPGPVVRCLEIAGPWSNFIINASTRMCYSLLFSQEYFIMTSTFWPRMHRQCCCRNLQWDHLMFNTGSFAWCSSRLPRDWHEWHKQVLLFQQKNIHKTICLYGVNIKMHNMYYIHILYKHISSATASVQVFATQPWAARRSGEIIIRCQLSTLVVSFPCRLKKWDFVQAYAWHIQ